VLVVVAIIALLIGILVPSLAAARTEAKIVSCQANANQLGIMMSSYQAEFREYVPLMINWHANAVYGTPPRNTWLSVALRKYGQNRYGLPKEYDPNVTGAWSKEKRQTYETSIMPDNFACPFERDNVPRVVSDGPDVAGYHTVILDGRHESWHVWLWEDIVVGDPMENKLPKYSVLSWNRVCAGGPTPMPDCVDADVRGFGDPKHPLLTTYRKWTIPDAQRVRAGSFSRVTVVYCTQGEHMELGFYRWNIGSHRRGGKGGTNALFADTHVEWVPGEQIGWP